MEGRRRKAVVLEVDDLSLSFAELHDFEFCLDARTEVPARKVAELLEQSPERLLEEAHNIRRVERRFMDVLSDALDDPHTLAVNMRALDRQLFSQDFRWRGIVNAVNALPDERDDFRRAALVRYLGYLRSRQEALRRAYDDIQAREDAPVPAPRPEANGPAALRETAIFQVEELNGETVATRYQSLPRGETVKLRTTDDPLRLLLSRHAFALHCAERLMLVDPAGTEHQLGRARNVVGRDLQNDVVVDAAFRDVSRRHLIVEVTVPGWVQLTDLSSHGTQVEMHQSAARAATA